MLRIAVSFSSLLLFFYIISTGKAARIKIENSKKPTCGYESCPKVDPKKLNVHLVAHTHDDVGWLKTVDQYYFGSRTLTQNAGVQYILDTVIAALRNHPDRRFIYVETAFLWKWWLRQDENIKTEVRSLINDGRLEIIGGGWCMNDEATTHYHSLIDQYTWGFRRLNDTFGKCATPRIGWQIDPFGHSREQASIFAEMGFDGMFFGRLDYQDKKKRLEDKSAEFIWNANPSLGTSSDLFSIALFNNYGPPPGFCFDVLCNDEPMIDDPDSPDYNIDYKVELFLSYCQIQSRSYNTNNIILTMGEDFFYQDATMSFVNLDMLIRYANDKHGSELNVFYSTPSCYLKSLNDLNMTWPTKSDDFFPYASDPHAYWTGYFSSRPTLKFFERMGNNLLQVVKQLSVLMNLKSNDPNLDHFRESMGVLQHHDAVAGTEKQHVANDYARILYKSMDKASDIASEAIGKWIAKEKNADPKLLVKFYSCMLMNISACPLTEENEHFVVSLYNPMSRTISPYIRIPVTGTAYIVKDFNGTEMVTQLVPIPDPVLKMAGRISKATSELIFRAFGIPALGYQSFYVIRKAEIYEKTVDDVEEISSIGGELYNITINDDGKVLVKWNNLKNMSFKQSFHYYEAAEGNNEVSENRSSGAYIFRPKQRIPRNIKYVGTSKFYKGPLVEELHQTVNEWISQVVRIYNDEERIEFNWMIGPIPTEEDEIGKEIISRYSSTLTTAGEFFTDSNARQMLKRRLDYRPTWNVKLDEPIAGNYYPITSKMYLKDKLQGLKFSVLTDRAQGGTSLLDGQLELMIHRRLLKDDAFGVDEALNETAFGKGLIARGQHHVFGSSLTDFDAILKEKITELELALRPWTLITSANDISFEEWSTKYNMQGESLKYALPPNVRILTLEPWKDDSVLLRLEHLFEIGLPANLSKPAEINIQNLFTPFAITSVRETTLGANRWKEDLNRLKWYPESNDVHHQHSPDRFTSSTNANDVNVNILLNPMQIRTFIVTISRI